MEKELKYEFNWSGIIVILNNTRTIYVGGMYERCTNHSSIEENLNEVGISNLEIYGSWQSLIMSKDTECLFRNLMLRFRDILENQPSQEKVNIISYGMSSLMSIVGIGNSPYNISKINKFVMLNPPSLNKKFRFKSNVYEMEIPYEIILKDGVISEKELNRALKVLRFLAGNTIRENGFSISNMIMYNPANLVLSSKAIDKYKSRMNSEFETVVPHSNTNPLIGNKGLENSEIVAKYLRK